MQDVFDLLAVLSMETGDAGDGAFGDDGALGDGALGDDGVQGDRCGHGEPATSQPDGAFPANDDAPVAESGPKPTPAEPAPVEASEVSLERLEARICSLASALASSTCEWLRLVAEFDRRKGWAVWGIKSCAHWLSWSCSVSPQAAREYLRVARTLEDAPLIRAAFAAGRLSYSKVKAITRAVGLLAEQTLLDQALVHTAAQLERVVRAFRRTDGAGLGQQHDRKAKWFWDDDGMLVFTARLPPDEGGILLAAMRQAEHSLGVPVDPDPCDPQPTTPSTVDPPTPAEHRPDPSPGPEPGGPKDSDRAGWSAADALLAMAQNALAAGPVDSSGDDRHLLVVHVDAALLGAAGDQAGTVSDDPTTHGKGLCQLEDGPGLDRSTMQRLSCDAAVVAVLRSSLGGSLTGEPLRLGRKTRKISAALRRALRIRDGGCQHPGCHRRRHLQAHHVVHWTAGGPTDLENLLLLCRFHHMQVHEAGFTVSFAGPVGNDATAAGWVFHRPDGVQVPAVRPLMTEPDTVCSTTAIDEDDDPERIHPGWRGERFSLAESVGVLCRAADDHRADHDAHHDAHDECAGTESDAEQIRDVPYPPSAPTVDRFEGEDFERFNTLDELVAFCRATLFYPATK